MYIHGGGWAAGAAQGSAAAMRNFADAGFIVVDIDYELATPSNPTWDKAPGEVACALAWTKQQAARWGGDPARLTVMGDSAGGNLAVNLGWSAGQGTARSTCPTLGPVPTPAAVIAAYPVVNPAYSYEHGVPSGSDPKSFIGEYLGGTPSQHPDRLVAISSLSYASPSAPPTLILEPERDDFIPAQGVYEVAHEAQARGVKLTLDRIPFAHHLFDGLPGTLGEQVKRSIVIHYLKGLKLAP